MIEVSDLPTNIVNNKNFDKERFTSLMGESGHDAHISRAIASFTQNARENIVKATDLQCHLKRSSRILAGLICLASLFAIVNFLYEMSTPVISNLDFLANIGANTAGAIFFVTVCISAAILVVGTIKRVDIEREAAYQHKQAKDLTEQLEDKENRACMRIITKLSA